METGKITKLFDQNNDVNHKILLCICTNVPQLSVQFSDQILLIIYRRIVDQNIRHKFT